MTTAPQLAGCVSLGLALVHLSARGIVRRRVIACPTCKRRTPAVQQWDGAYYGCTTYCTVCVDGWQDGEMMPRPFRPRWKPERAAHIRELWDGAMLPAHYQAWTHYDVHRALCWDDEACTECANPPT